MAFAIRTPRLLFREWREEDAAPATINQRARGIICPKRATLIARFKQTRESSNLTRRQPDYVLNAIARFRARHACAIAILRKTPQ